MYWLKTNIMLSILGLLRASVVVNLEKDLTI